MSGDQNPVNPSKNPFVSNHISRARYIWDPKVHQLYNEQCFYFLLRLRNPDNVLIENLRDLIIKEGILSFCYYSLYGYYDVLIRMWAAAHKRARFINTLERLKDNIESISEFQAREINYSWSGAKPPEVLLSLKTDIERVSPASNGSEVLDSATLERLVKEGVVHFLKETNQNCIKFYIALTKLPGTYSTPFEYQHLTDSILKAQLPVSNISIYSGLGFASYLVKAVALEYKDIINSTTKMLDFLRPLALRPMTLLIANSDSWESDLIDVEWDRLPKNLAQLDLLLGSAAADAAARLSSEQQHDLSAVFEKFRDLLNTPLASVFKDLILAWLGNNQIAFIEKLSFVMRLEGLLRRYFIEECSSILGRDWLDVIKRLATECKITPPDKSPASYTMHDLVTVLNKLVETANLPADRVQEVLGVDWFAQLKSLPELRNEFAHGKLYDDAKIFERWPRIVNVALTAGQVYNRLVNRYAKPSTIGN